MKTHLQLFALVSILSLTLFSSCTKDTCEREMTWIESTPVWVNPDNFREPIESEAARPLRQPGKLYFYNDYIFINEKRVGVHVVDNSDPNNPQRISFLPIAGNVDIAIKGDILYADNYVDLVTFDIKDPTNARLLNRNEDVFPHQGTDENGFFIAYYEFEERTEVMDCNQQGQFFNRGGWFFNDRTTAEAFDAGGGFNNQATGAASGIGTGGSLARFTIVGNYLYTIDQVSLHVYDIQQLENPQWINTVDVAWNIETIFPYTDKLFIAGNNGLYIYDNSNPTAPSFLSQFTHATACDPVYVKDNYAYVTLRSGNRCEGFSNQLDLIDISDIRSPRLEKTFPMENPHGLGIKDNSLFLCEGEHGIKVFDIEEPQALDRNLLDRIKDIHAYDAIPVPGQEDVLLVIGDDGFYQYDSSEPKKMKLMSSIPVEK